LVLGCFFPLSSLSPLAHWFPPTFQLALVYEAPSFVFLFLIRAPRAFFLLGGVFFGLYSQGPFDSFLSFRGCSVCFTGKSAFSWQALPFFWVADNLFVDYMFRSAHSVATHPSRAPPFSPFCTMDSGPAAPAFKVCFPILVSFPAVRSISSSPRAVASPVFFARFLWTCRVVVLPCQVTSFDFPF